MEGKKELLVETQKPKERGQRTPKIERNGEVEKEAAGGATTEESTIELREAVREAIETTKVLGGEKSNKPQLMPNMFQQQDSRRRWLIDPQPGKVFTEREINAYRAVFGEELTIKALARLEFTEKVNPISFLRKRLEWIKREETSGITVGSPRYYLFNEVVTDKYTRMIMDRLGPMAMVLDKLGSWYHFGSHRKAEEEWNRIMDVVKNRVGEIEADRLERKAYLFGDVELIKSIYDSSKEESRETFDEATGRVDGHPLYKKRGRIGERIKAFIKSFIGGGAFVQSEQKLYLNNGPWITLIGFNATVAFIAREIAEALFRIPWEKIARGTTVVPPELISHLAMSGGAFLTLWILPNLLIVPAILRAKFHEGCHAVSFSEKEKGHCGLMKK